MNRRNFTLALTLSPLLLKGASFKRTFFNEKYVVISELFDVLFVKTKTMPSAKEFGAIDYLISNIEHSSFPLEDKKFLLQGAEDFKDSFPEFFSKSLEEKTKELHSIQANSDYAQDWMSMLIYYGIEAMLSDPIYGGNKNKQGWSAIQHPYGKPQPKKQYGQKV